MGLHAVVVRHEDWENVFHIIGGDGVGIGILEEKHTKRGERLWVRASSREIL